MVIATLGEVVAVYRSRAALAPARVAERAGISTGQYLALEHGTAWPGTEAAEAVIDALQIPHRHRVRLATAGAPLETYLQSMLHRYDIPALIVDNAWRTVEANSFARILLPDSARPGWNLMRWVLLDSEARRRLANWQDVAPVFAATLRDSITAAPHDTELAGIRQDAAQLKLPAANASTNCPDGQVLAWRTDRGPHPISACLVTVPGGRPDLRQIAFVPRPALPAPVPTPAQPGPAAPWSGPLLTDLLACGLCGLLLTGGGRPATYQCATGCLPELLAEDLEVRIAERVLTHAFSTEACRELGVAQEILAADGMELELNVPVSPKHALDQWQRSMSDTQRRGILTTTLRTATVHPTQRGADLGVGLAFTWRAVP
ncbi:XRE family transcriptional regulator [Streptomyces niveus]|uniref:MmyB family transcriptional regulator n=1 Tax=Streptomyces niveus TaxID=193462 RepID=UPI003661C4B9